MDVTKRLAQFTCQATLDDFRPEVVSTAKAGITDCLGVMLAGIREPLTPILVEFVRRMGGQPQATVVGHGFKTSTPNAALVNGAMAHALDYDDINHLIKGHPSVVVLPPALAVGEEVNATGADLVLAYIIGFEVSCAVGAGMGIDYSDNLGWHPTGPLGTLGAAAGAACLFKLSQEQAVQAIAIAASQASGLRENFGTMTKPFHPGNAARSGVVAAMLAQGGYTASATAIEGRYGFMHAFSGGQGYDPDAVVSRLGKEMALLEPGLDVKKYPCCGSTHLTLDALFQLLEREQVDADSIEEVEVRVDFDPPRSLIHYDPKSALEGKFSMQYCVAAALLDNHIGLGTFTDAGVQRPEAQRLMKKVKMVRNAGYEGTPSWGEAFHEIHLRLRDGRVLSQRADRQTEGFIRGATPNQLREKYRDCASLALPQGKVETSLEILDHLEELDRVSRLTELLVAETARM